MSIRLIDAGTVSHLRSQSIYHGLAHALGEETPDTVVLLTPGEPYVCIGLHQTLEKQLDAEYCRRHELPILRREVGGGAVYLDRDQTFVQWVMGPGRLPVRLEQRFELFVRPLVETLRVLGIDAAFRPVNDIQVGGRKISGTGAARIGAAEVLVANFIFDFDSERMSRILRVPSDTFRDTVRRGLERYMTTIERELGSRPDRDEVKAIYLRKLAEVLGTDVVPGELTEREQQSVEAMDRKLSSPTFRDEGGGLRRRGLKIHEDVYVAESLHEAAGGRITVTARRAGNRLEDVSLAGDFGTHAGGGLGGLELALEGVEAHHETVTRVVAAYLEENRVQAPGVTVSDWVQAIMGLLDNREGQGNGR